MYNRFSINPKGGFVMTICPIVLYVGGKNCMIPHIIRITNYYS